MVIPHGPWQGQVKGQQHMSHQFRLLRAEASYKLCTNRSGRFYIMFVCSGVPKIAHEFQGQGQVRSTIAIKQKKNEEEEVRNISFMEHFRLILKR